MKPPSPSRSTCPRCSRQLAGGALKGNCPSCLLELATAFSLQAAREPSSRPVDFNRYKLLQILAPGGLGVAWRARHRDLGGEVVLKMISLEQVESSALLERFRLEAAAAARLKHPNIVPVLEAGETDGRYLYTMPLLAGGSLAGRLTSGPLLPKDAAYLVAAAARAVHFAHEHGVQHGRLKASNVLLDELGEPHVADFGLASLALDHASLPQLDVTPASDVYGLGAVLDQLVSGRAPFPNKTPQASDLEEIALKCMAAVPAQRPSSAAALADELERWLQALGTETTCP